jgi:hypothetical protein
VLVSSDTLLAENSCRSCADCTAVFLLNSFITYDLVDICVPND